MIEIKNQQRINQLKDTLSGLSKESNLCLVYDIDADGMSSGVLLKRAFEKLGLSFKLELTDITRKAVFCEDNLKKINDKGIDCIVVTDIALAGFNLLGACEDLQKKGVKFLVFDHHEYAPPCRKEIRCSYILWIYLARNIRLSAQQSLFMT
jgi:single-stranded DNA-specific DHH superfamily exonuclease